MNITGIVVDVLKLHAPALSQRTEIGAHTPLFAGGAELDSLALLEAVLDIESRTGVSLREELLAEGALTTVGSLVQCIQARINEDSTLT